MAGCTAIPVLSATGCKRPGFAEFATALKFCWGALVAVRVLCRIRPWFPGDSSAPVEPPRLKVFRVIRASCVVDILMPTSTGPEVRHPCALTVLIGEKYEKS